VTALVFSAGNQQAIHCFIVLLSISTCATTAGPGTESPPPPLGVGWFSGGGGSSGGDGGGGGDGGLPNGGGVYVVGHSRGAKISMLQATGDPRVKAGCLLAGAYTRPAFSSTCAFLVKYAG